MTNNWSLYDGFIKQSKGHFQISASTSRMEMKLLGTSWLNTEICKISSQLPVRSVFNMPICRLLKMPLYWDQWVVLISNLTWRYIKKKRIDCHQKKQPSEVFYKKKVVLRNLAKRTPFLQNTFGRLLLHQFELITWPIRILQTGIFLF